MADRSSTSCVDCQANTPALDPGCFESQIKACYIINNAIWRAECCPTLDMSAPLIVKHNRTPLSDHPS